MTSGPSSKAPASRRGLLPWLQLFALTALLLLIIHYVAPLGLRLPGYRQMERFIADNDLKATAIYYSDLEEFARAQSSIRDRLRYAPVDSTASSRPHQSRPATNCYRKSPPAGDRPSSLKTDSIASQSEQ